MQLSWRVAWVPALVVIASMAGWPMYRKRVAQQKLLASVRTYYEKAQRGNAEAEYRLGEAYREDKGLPRDYSEALVWYRKAADQGYAPA